jgi:valyl-tRNA synthetase
MIMFGIEFTELPPFHTVYLHGLVRVDGQKMSKTKGNTQNPLEVLEKYGTDALRLALTIGNTPGNDFTLTEGNLESRRDFVNKLWNVGRFVFANAGPHHRASALEPLVASADATLADRWLVSRLNRTVAESTRLLSEFNFGEGTRTVYDFLWDEFADWYVEAYKALARRERENPALLAQAFEKVLRLLHPVAPFVTEELWQRLLAGTEVSDRPVSLMIAPWPEPSAPQDAEAERQWEDIQAVVRAARSLRTDYRLEPSRWVQATIAAPDESSAAFWRQHAGMVGELPGTRLRPVEVAQSHSVSGLAEGALAAVAGGVEIFVPAEGLFDVEAETRRAEAERTDARQQVERIEGLLGGRDFIEKAKPEVVQRARDQLTEQQERLATLERRHATLERLRGG